jgi:SAM-dependent methyltransferase
MPMSSELLREKISKYDWYHSIRVTDEVATPGHPAFVGCYAPVLKVFESLDFTGKKVLDVGCRDGLMSFEAERRGAQEIVGIDNNLSRGAIELLIPAMGSKVHMVEMNCMDLKPDTFGLFDMIVFSGVLYHLRYPFWVLKLLTDCLVVGGTMLIETGILMNPILDEHALLWCPTKDESPYESTSCTFYNKKGLIDTMESLGVVLKIVNEFEQWGGVGRGIFIGTKQSLEDNFTNRYWHGNHSFHSESV